MAAANAMLWQPVLAVGADVAGDLAATHREADERDVAKVEPLDEVGEVWT